MFGYILATLVGLVLIAICVGALTGTRTQPGAGRRKRGVTVEGPAADEPTPDASVTATRAEQAAARRHTPPA